MALDPKNKDKFVSVVKQAGLSKNEALVYTTLLDLGESSMTKLSIRSGLKRPSAYNVIESLDLLGLISKVEHGKRHFYSAVHPKRLLQLAKYKQSQIEKSMPELLGVYAGKSKKPKIQMFEGMDGVRHVYKEIFEELATNKEELLIFTNIGKVNEKFPEIPVLFTKKMKELSFKSNVRELMLDDEAGREYSERMKKEGREPYAHRLIKGFDLGDNEQFILKNRIIFFSLSEDVYTISIESEDLAKTHRVMFEMAWQNAKVFI